MKVENQQELEKLVKFMRKAGVKALEFNELGSLAVELYPGDPPQSEYMRRKVASSAEAIPAAAGLTGLNDEQILFWSSTPPGTEPLKDS